jgi:prepilin-type N-terminal cleavage/methylation domain-containing protein
MIESKAENKDRGRMSNFGFRISDFGIFNPQSAIRNPQSSAFTLIELLVVVAIIAVLISILVPSLNEAKETSLKIGCVANLHHIYAMIVLYAQDNDMYLPPTAWKTIAEGHGWWGGTCKQSNGDYPVGLGLLEPRYTPQRGVQKILFCPADTKGLQARQNPAYFNYTYMNLCGKDVYIHGSTEVWHSDGRVRVRARRRLGEGREPYNAVIEVCNWWHGPTAKDCVVDPHGRLTNEYAPLLFLDGRTTIADFTTYAQKLYDAGLIPTWNHWYNPQWYKPSSPGYWDMLDAWP